MDIIKSYIHLYQIYLLKIIQQTKTIGVINVLHLIKLVEKLNAFTNKSKICILESITEKLYNKIEDIQLFFEINHLLVKHFIKNQESVKFGEEKMNQVEFTDKLVSLPSNKFITWFLKP